MKAELPRIARPPRPSRTGDLGSPPRQLWLAGLGLDRSHARDVERRFEALVPGVPPKVIASRMGHADAQVLFRHYIKEFDAQDREAAETMAAALREAGRRATRRAHVDGDDG
jgi:hypothetical protein